MNEVQESGLVVKLSDGDALPATWAEAEAAAARSRLALTRVLIWAEHEATALRRPDVAAEIKEAISRLHSRP